MNWKDCLKETIKFPAARKALYTMLFYVAAVWFVVVFIKHDLLLMVACLACLFGSNSALQEFGKYYLTIKSGGSLDPDK